MYSLGQKQKTDFSFQGTERLIAELSLLLDIAINLKSLEGTSMIGIPEDTRGIKGCRETQAMGACGAERLHLIQQVSQSGATVLQNCDDMQVIGIPVLGNQGLLGILCACGHAGQGTMIGRAAMFLEELAKSISCDMEAQFETESMACELSHRYEELNLIYDIGKELRRIISPEEAIEFIAAHLLTTFESDAFVISLPNRNILHILCSSPSCFLHDSRDRSSIARLNEIVMEKLSSSDTYPLHIVLDRGSDAALPMELLNNHIEILAAPIKLKSSIIGILYSINGKSELTFEAGDMRLLMALSEQISMIVTNAELYQDLKDFLLSVIRTLVIVIEAKDSYTKGHSERVSTLAMMLAETLDLPATEKEAISWASILHDIGKVGIPGNILSKPDRLTSEEFRRIQEHSEKGYEILKPIEQLNKSLIAIRHHHERYDGTGYPAGLKGKEIPLQSRIIAIADTYDAMTSARSYRSHIPHNDAVAELIRVKGKQLDPELVEIFIQCLNNGLPEER